MRKWSVTVCTCRSPRTSNAIAITPVSTSTIKIKRAIRWGANRRGRLESRPGFAGAGSGFVIIRFGLYAASPTTPAAAGSPSSDEQRLRRAADPALLVMEHAFRDSNAAVDHPGLCLHADPFADRLALHVQGQVRVDEQVVVP